jgi:hypothetical protein
MPLNFQTNHPRQPRNRIHAPRTDPRSLPLNQHPKWMDFIRLIGEPIMTQCPDFRPQFLELLDQADLL